MLMLSRRWLPKSNPRFIQLVGVGVPEFFQPKVVHLEVGFVVPDPLVPLLVAQIETLGIIGFLQSVMNGIEGPFLMPQLCTLWLIPRNLCLLDT